MPRKKNSLRITIYQHKLECISQGVDIPLLNQKYVNRNTNLKYLCSKHKQVYYQAPYTHLKGHLGCKKCIKKLRGTIGSNRKNQGEKQYYLFLKANNIPLKCLESYKGSKTPIMHKCLICGNKWRVSPSNIKRGKGCPQCSAIKRGQQRYKQYQDDYYNLCKQHNIVCLDEYQGYEKAIEHKCLVCHYVFKDYPRNMIHNKGGCPICTKGIPMSEKDYDYYLKFNKIPIKRVGSYKGKIVSIKHKCLLCGRIILTTPNNIINNGTRCQCTRISHGEHYIRNYLDTNNIRYIPEKRFKKCKDKHTLPFDFYLPEYNTLIEYQGRQHFEYCEIFYKTQKDLKDRKHKDYLKAKYAKENGYKLLRPTYKTNTQEKINKYLDRYLLKSLDK